MSGEMDRHRAFFEASGDAMLIVEDDRFIDCNSAALEMLGFDNREELFSTHPAEISPKYQDDGRDSFEKATELFALVAKEKSIRFKWTHIRKNGEHFPVEVSLTQIPYEDKIRLNVVWRDISERVALEQELISQKNRLEDLVQERTEELETALRGARLLGEAVSQSGASIIITDRQGNIEYVNPAFTEINGYTPEEIYGKKPSILSSGMQQQDFYQDMWQTISRGEFWSGTLRNIRKNGEMYWAKLKISPVTNANGQISNYVGIETDISDFIEAKEKAERANKAKSEFLSSMSHELRTPLNAILGFSQLLQIEKQTSYTDAQHSYLDNISKAGDHLLGLIDEVLDLARVEAGKLTFDFQTVNVRLILDDCMDLSEASYNTLNVTVEDRTDQELPLLRVDPLRFKQVLLNLISNAKKYNSENGFVYLNSEILMNGSLRISVRDTGGGIALDRQKDLFKPFNRLGKEDSGVEGTGIGLLLTKQIVEEMQGQIGFESTPGQGTVFWVDFPIEEGEFLQQRTFTLKDRNEFSLECCDDLHTLLYVEDIAMNRDLMEGLVKQIPNLELICAENGQQGLDMAREMRPHLILMDINLPDMSGFDAYEKLQEMGELSQIPVVALSANAMNDAKLKAKKLGFHEYMTKPFDLEDLVYLLNNVIED